MIKKFIHYGFITLIVMGFFTHVWAAGASISEPTVSEEGVLSFSMKRVPGPEFFEEHPEITSVIINEWSNESGQGLNLTCFEPLQEPLARLPVSLHLNDQGMEAEDVGLLSRSLSLFPQLKVLDLSNNSIGLIGMDPLTGGLRHVKDSLEELFLRNLGPGKPFVKGEIPESMEGFDRLVEGLSKLRVLDFSYNEFSPQEVVKLVGRFKDLPLLEELYLEGTQVDSWGQFSIGTKSFDCIVDNLCRIPKLKNFPLYGHSFTPLQQIGMDNIIRCRRLGFVQPAPHSRRAFWKEKGDESVVLFYKNRGQKVQVF